MAACLKYLLFIGLVISTLHVSAQDAPIYQRREADPPKQSIMERLTLGGNFGLSFGNPMYINISPLIGYKINPRFFAGAGPSYIYSRTRYSNPRVTFRTNILGGRAFAQHAIIQNFSLRAEYELLQARYPLSITSTGDIVEGTTWLSNPMAGAAYMLPVGNRSFFNIMVLYNFGYAANERNRLLYNSPWVVRMGFQL